MGQLLSFFKNQESDEFIILSLETNDLELPVPAKNRAVTDKQGFIFLGILMLILLPFLTYTLIKSDIRRYTHGSDSCGNLCGIASKKIADIECSGKNFTNKPYELVHNVTRKQTCIDKCPPGYYEIKDRRCSDSDKKDEKNVLVDSFNFWWKYLVVIAITIVMCILTLLLFRFCPQVMVCGVIIFGLLLMIAVTGLFWVFFSDTPSTDPLKYVHLVLALITTTFTGGILLLYLVFRKYIPLISLLYKETATALFAMPLMIFFPIITLALQLVVICLLVLTAVVMQTAGNLEKHEDDDFYSYQKNGAMVFALIFNIFTAIWAKKFFSGWQYMVLSGSVAQWFFKKNSSFPICTSLSNTSRYHLGTVALGTFIIMLVTVIRGLIKTVFCWVRGCVTVEACLEIVSKKAFIETAIHGQSFFKCGKRATNLLVTNIVNVLSINSTRDFISGLTKFILLVILTTISYLVFMNNDNAWFPVVLSFVVNFNIVVVFFSVFESTVETLLVCSCEDTILNDGAARPFNMSPGLMRFIEETKKYGASR